jgi:hypothetical protein
MNKSLLVSLLVFQLALSQTISDTYIDPTIKLRTCYIGGCNGEVCSPFPVKYFEVGSVVADSVDATDSIASVCYSRPIHKCLSFARCERQVNGGCDFTLNLAFMKCLMEAYATVDPMIFEDVFTSP